MTTAWSFILCCVVVLYLGCVLGLLYQCENNDVLNNTYEAAFFAPFILVIVFFLFLSDSIKGKNLRAVIGYFKTPEKGIIILACYKKAHIKNKERYKRRQTIKSSWRYAAEIAKPLFCVGSA